MLRNIGEAGARAEGLRFITHMRDAPKYSQPDTLLNYHTESLLVWRYSAFKWPKKPTLPWESTGTPQASHSKVVAVLHEADEALLHCWVKSTSLLHTVQPVCNRPSNLTKDCLLSSCPAPAPFWLTTKTPELLHLTYTLNLQLLFRSTSKDCENLMSACIVVLPEISLRRPYNLIAMKQFDHR